MTTCVITYPACIRAAFPPLLRLESQELPPPKLVDVKLYRSRRKQFCHHVPLAVVRVDLQLRGPSRIANHIRRFQQSLDATQMNGQGLEHLERLSELWRLSLA